MMQDQGYYNLIEIHVISSDNVKSFWAQLPTKRIEQDLS